jgi:glycosyltransferase involved in cell wall biosynthesis
MPDVTAKLASGHRSPNASATVPPKRNILIVGHITGDMLFGAERSLLDLLAAIDPAGYEVSCVLPGGSDAYLQAAARHAKNVTVFPFHWWTCAQPFDEQAVAQFENVIRRRRPDLVHVNTIMLSDPLIAARRLQVPSVVHTRELIDADPDLARHFGCEATDVVSSIRAAADFIIANSDTTHRLYYKQDRSFRLYNSIDVERFNLPNDFEPGRLKVGIISSNVPKKGIEHFVKLAILASHRLPHLEFLVIGPRTEHAIDLERVAQAEEFPVNLRFTGYVADPVEAVRQVNVVVSFSIFAESFGRTIAEAMAASRPVIAYGWGAAPELVRDGKDGFIIPYLEFQTALDCLQVLTDNPDRVQEMGRNGRERARELFAPDRFAANLNDIYRQIAAMLAPRNAGLADSSSQNGANTGAGDRPQ